MRHWWNNTDRGRQKISEKNLSQCHFVQRHFLNWFSSYCVVIVLLLSFRANRNFGDFSLFNIAFKRRKCSAVRCASAANAIDSAADIINGRSFSVNDWLLSDTSTA
jgi:hypothetical protein